MSRRNTLFLAVGILLLAAFMRLALIANLPPGMDNDEAFHLLRAQEILRGESLPVYITGNNGNEPLYAYLAVIGLTLVGPTAWAGRLMSAFVGLIGVALIIRLGQEMFPRRAVGLLAGLILATLLWHVNLSRFGSQAILATTPVTATITALSIGARTGSRRYYILAGISLGLGLDGYLIVRLFVAVAAVAGLAWLIAARPDRRKSIIRGGLWAAGSAVLVYAPLALYFIQNPKWFLNRYSQTTEGVLNAPTMLTNALQTVGGLFWQGDVDWRFNLAGQPAFDVVLSLAFLVGILVLVWRWRKPESWACAAWIVVGLTPSVMTSPAPHFGRTAMAVPALVVVAALGIVSVWQVIRVRLGRVLIASGVAVSALVPIWLYFGVWANDVRVAQSFDIQQFEIAEQLQAAPARAALYATPLNVGWIHDYWTIEYLLGSQGRERYAPFNGTLCNVAMTDFPYGARYVLAATEADDIQRTPGMLQRVFSHVETTVLDVPGERFPMTIFDVPPGSHAQINATPIAEFGNSVRLLEYTPQTLAPGKPLRLDLTWQVLKPTPVPYKLFLHLLGAPKADSSVVYAQYDGEPCAQLWHTNRWPPGELLFETYKLRLVDVPPGKYTLTLGWYTETTGERLAIAPSGATEYKLGEFTIP